MNYLKKAIMKYLLSLSVFICSVLYVQTSNAQCNCKDALANSQNVTIYQDLEHLYEAEKKFYEKLEKSGEFKKENASVNVNAIGKGNGDAAYNKTDIATEYKGAVGYINNLRIRDRSKLVSMVTGNKYAYEAYNNCINKCKSKTQSFVVPKIMSSSKIKLTVYGINKGEKNIKIHQLIYDNLKFSQPNNTLSSGDEISVMQPSVFILEKIDESQDGYISIVFEAQEEEQVHFPKPMEKIELPELPEVSKLPKIVYLNQEILVGYDNVNLTFNKTHWSGNAAPIIQGTKYEQCVGMHAPKKGIGEATFVIPENAIYFNAYFGLAENKVIGRENQKSYFNEAQFRGTVYFNGEKAKVIIRKGSGGKGFSIQIPKNAKTMTLVTDNYNGTSYCDRATWAEACFTEKKKYE